MSKDFLARSSPSAEADPPARLVRSLRPSTRSNPRGGGRARCGLATAALAMLLGGCFRQEEFTYPYANLAGEVTVDGVPIEAGVIAFLSLDPGNGQMVSTSIVRGRYLAKKVPQGKVMAVVTAFKETGRSSTVEGRRVPETVNLIPPRYQNGFELDVKVQTFQRVDFKMTRAEAEPRAAPSEGEGASPDSGTRPPDSEESEPTSRRSFLPPRHSREDSDTLPPMFSLRGGPDTPLTRARRT